MSARIIAGISRPRPALGYLGSRASDSGHNRAAKGRQRGTLFFFSLNLVHTRKRCGGCAYRARRCSTKRPGNADAIPPWPRILNASGKISRCPVIVPTYPCNISRLLISQRSGAAATRETRAKRETPHHRALALHSGASRVALNSPATKKPPITWEFM